MTVTQSLTPSNGAGNRRNAQKIQKTFSKTKSLPEMTPRSLNHFLAKDYQGVSRVLTCRFARVPINARKPLNPEHPFCFALLLFAIPVREKTLLQDATKKSQNIAMLHCKTYFFQQCTNCNSSVKIALIMQNFEALQKKRECLFHNDQEIFLDV